MDTEFDRNQSLAVVVPTYNEATNLPILANRLFALGMSNAWLIIVDDGSPDGTSQVALNLSTHHGWRINVINRTKKLGLGTAYIEGFTRALELGVDYVVQMDADLSHEPEYIPEFLEALIETDVVVGSRYTPGGGVDYSWSPSRRFLSHIGNLGIRLITGLRVKDATSGFKAFDARVLASMKLTRFRCKGFAFQAEIAHACQILGYRTAEHPIVFRNRANGKSKMSITIVVEAISKLLPLRLRTKTRISEISDRKYLASRKFLR